jgi:hypothetical protein
MLLLIDNDVRIIFDIFICIAVIIDFMNILMRRMV